ncbi:MAG: 3-deoxy-7-phosphoheptulonate synthase [Erysipelothrix sp.]|nr:3-deoxy-7-phosphoheptulonate synthase [Erysipelothrix sp.]
MIITIKAKTPKSELKKLIIKLEGLGFNITKNDHANKVMVNVFGDTTTIDDNAILAFLFVESVTRISAPYKRVNRDIFKEDVIVNVNGILIGNKQPIAIIAGPCSVESEESLNMIAASIKKSGAKLLRGGAFKPRTSPYAFQGLGVAGIDLLKKANQKYNLPIVSEISAASQIELFEANVDILQVGARNMQNFELLKALGKTSKPILLKRGFANTIEEWLMSAEYIVSAGNPNVILCERGIRTFETYTRNTLDLSVIPIIKQKSNLPIIVDPSHATGDWRLVEKMAMAAIVAGADGLMIEVHDNPEMALSDGAQSLTLENFDKLMVECRKMAKAIEREI